MQGLSKPCANRASCPSPLPTAWLIRMWSSPPVLADRRTGGACRSPDNSLRVRSNARTRCSLRNGARRGSARHTADTRRRCAPRATADAGVPCAGWPVRQCYATFAGADDTPTACMPVCSRPSGCSVACHRTPDRHVRRRQRSSKGNSIRNALRSGPVVGSCRLLRIRTQVDADPHWRRQALPSLNHVVGPAVVSKSQDRARSPKLDMEVQGPQLAIGELAGIALPQLIEYRSSCSFGWDDQPLTNLIPHGFKRVRACAIGARPLELLAATVPAPLPCARWQADSLVAGHTVNTHAARSEIKWHR